MQPRTSPSCLPTTKQELELEPCRSPPLPLICALPVLAHPRCNIRVHTELYAGAHCGAPQPRCARAQQRAHQLVGQDGRDQDGRPRAAREAARREGARGEGGAQAAQAGGGGRAARRPRLGGAAARAAWWRCQCARRRRGGDVPPEDARDSARVRGPAGAHPRAVWRAAAGASGRGALFWRGGVDAAVCLKR
eukprot:364425-Chlamydomonas_euryale.AAC.1